MSIDVPTGSDAACLLLNLRTCCFNPRFHTGSESYPMALWWSARVFNPRPRMGSSTYWLMAICQTISGSLENSVHFGRTRLQKYTYTASEHRLRSFERRAVNYRFAGEQARTIFWPTKVSTLPIQWSAKAGSPIDDKKQH